MKLVPARARKAVRPARRHAQLLRAERTIIRSGVFDVEWYEAQCGERFPSLRAAVRHYLRSPRRLGHSPHPLFEADSFDTQWHKRTPDPFVHYLDDATMRGTSSPHPSFDLGRARQLIEEWGPLGWREEVATDGLWLTWVRSATGQSVLPLPKGRADITWGELRQTLLTAARRWRAQLALGEPLRQVSALPTTPLASADPAPETPSGERPRVSVVIATWNRSASIRRAVASVQAQSWRDLEVIVVDDGSDDDTASVVNGITAFDARVRYISRARGGVCAARNAGLAEARGDYVGFLDSDNAWEPDFLAVMVRTMEAEGWSMAHGALQTQGGSAPLYRAAQGSRQSLLVGNHIDLNVLLVSRALLDSIGGFDESLRRAVDYDLVLRLSAHTTPRLVAVVGAQYADDPKDFTRISTREPVTWNQVVRGRHLIDWEDAATRPRQEGRISVVIPVVRHLYSMLDWLDLARQETAAAPELDVEIVLVGIGCRSQYCILSARALGLQVKLIPHPTYDRIALLSNLGAAASTGAVLVLARSNCHLRRPALARLRDALSDASVAVAQPLVERGDMTVASAGGVFGPGSVQPHPLLEGFPVSDALEVGDCDLPAALSPVVALRAHDLCALRGFDPLFGNSLPETDLSLRAREVGLGSTRLVTAARTVAHSQSRAGFTHDMAQSTRILTERWVSSPEGSAELWSRAGFDAVSYRPVALTGSPLRAEKVWGLRPEPHRSASVQVSEGLPSLRWSIDIAAPAGARGEQWGDRHFASALARALQRRGQCVAIDHREARLRRTRIYDDVVVVLRGLDEVFPSPGPTNVLWVISHPDRVTPWEIARYHAVFAASTPWATETSERWGVRVRPLLQCTDPQLFDPERAPVGGGPALLFVGNARRVFRPIVRHAVATGAELMVYGGGWEGMLDPKVIAGTHVPNQQVGALYASAGLVLTDHWDDMRAAGFMSNRLFDAVACGSRVVSDDVPGLSETFGDSVFVMRSQPDLDRVVRAPYLHNFPDQATRQLRARRVQQEHSFDARADQLLTEVLRQRNAGAMALEQRDPGANPRRW